MRRYEPNEPLRLRQNADGAYEWVSGTAEHDEAKPKVGRPAKPQKPEQPQNEG